VVDAETTRYFRTLVQKKARGDKKGHFCGLIATPSVVSCHRGHSFVSVPDDMILFFTPARENSGLVMGAGLGSMGD
jgi:hypothetical protein